MIVIGKLMSIMLFILSYIMLVERKITREMSKEYIKLVSADKWSVFFVNRIDDIWVFFVISSQELSSIKQLFINIETGLVSRASYILNISNCWYV